MIPKTHIIYGMSACVAAFGILAVILFMRVPLEHQSLPATTLSRDANSAVPHDPFAGITLTAHAAYVFDAERGVPLFALHENVQLPLASLTKIMTALVAIETGEPDDTITVTGDAIALEGDQGLRQWEKWRLGDLIDLMLLSSSNDGAHAIASAVGATEGTLADADIGNAFVRAMNQKARALSLTQTYFLNESGLDVNEGVSGAYGSARDVARLLEYVIMRHPEIIEATRYKMLETASLKERHTAKNTNQFVENIPGLIASKTGFTDLAGGNLAIAFDAGLSHPVIVVVLGSTEKERFTDAGILIDAAMQYFSGEKLL
mgnify:CR=1 FL=1